MFCLLQATLQWFMTVSLVVVPCSRFPSLFLCQRSSLALVFLMPWAPALCLAPKLLLTHLDPRPQCMAPALYLNHLAPPPPPPPLTCQTSPPAASHPGSTAKHETPLGYALLLHGPVVLKWGHSKLNVKALSLTHESIWPLCMVSEAILSTYFAMLPGNVLTAI